MPRLALLGLLFPSVALAAPTPNLGVLQRSIDVVAQSVRFEAPSTLVGRQGRRVQLDAVETSAGAKVTLIRNGELGFHYLAELLPGFNQGTVTVGHSVLTLRIRRNGLDATVSSRQALSLLQPTGSAGRTPSSEWR